MIHIAAVLLLLVWQPSSGHVQVPIWPYGAPGLQAAPGAESISSSKHDVVAGKPYSSIANVTEPTMTVYAPKIGNTHAAVVVFPGGGFQILAIDLEGTEVCDWLTARGITCVLLKYRVPGAPYDWHCSCYPNDLAISKPALQDAQRTIRLVRAHAAQWRIDPHKIGVIGFSAGGFMVAETSTMFNDQTYPRVDAADDMSSRPDFAMAIYPGHLADNGHLNSRILVTHTTPPTFLVQAEDDHVDNVADSLLYAHALKSAGVPVEIHVFPKAATRLACGALRCRSPDGPILLKRGCGRSESSERNLRACRV